MKRIDPAMWSALSPLLDELLEMEESQCQARLAKIGRERPDLAEALRALLHQSRMAEGEQFLAGTAIATTADASLDGQRIGAYTLQRCIGEGGMGSVWLAQRSDGRFEGAVAVKLLNLALVGRGGAERFAREGRILGRLSHPNIARLVDAGVTGGGQPYLVLEYVEGRALDSHCNTARLDTRARIALLLGVIDAVSHAHRNLVLHRDLKPSNILVNTEGEVKLLDFGIAKLLQDADTPGEVTEITRLAGRAFTPEYAAPEQVQGGHVTTATDVYALGVLLYSLLGGRHPTTQDTDSPVDRLRGIAERVPARLSTVAAKGDSLVALQRSTTPAHLARELRGDLETIVGKALKKDPGERYATVDAFALDLRRYLQGETVSARPDSIRYRASKFVARNRAAVALVAFALVALLGGLFGTITQAQRATRAAEVAQAHSVRADHEAQQAAAQRDFALRQVARLDAVNDLNALLLTDAVHAGKPLRVGDLLARAEALIAHQPGPIDPGRIDMLVAIGLQYKFMDQDDKARVLLERAYRASRSMRDVSARVSAGCAYGVAIRGYDDARGAVLVRASLAELPDDRAFDIERLSCLTSLGEIARNNDDAAVAIESADAAVSLVERLPFLSPSWRVRVLMDRAESYRIAERHGRAIADFQTAEQQLIALGREATERATTLYNNWALTLDATGRPLEAEGLFRRAIRNSGGDGSTDVSPMLLVNYARVLDRLGRYAEASRLAALAYARAQAAGDGIIVNHSLLVRAAAARHLGAFGTSAALLAEAEIRFGRTLPEGHRGKASLASQWSLLAESRADFITALAKANEALRLAGGEQVNRLHVALLLRRCAEVEIAMQRSSEAYEHAGQALAKMKASSESAGPSADLGMAYATIGRAAHLQGNVREARESWTSALAELRPTLGADHPQVRAADRALAALPP
ncbi:MAG: serine/threonine-protein kinase [Casimicrobiaceae bacterium]